MLINITVEEKRAAVIGTPIIICGNSDYSIEFSFDEEWEGLEAKTARFVYVQNGAVKHEDNIFTGNTVAVPVLINTRWVRVGVFAGDLRTTTPATIPCITSILCSGGPVADPRPDQYNQIMELLNKLDTGGGTGEDAEQLLEPSVTDNAYLEWYSSSNHAAGVYVQTYSNAKFKIHCYAVTAGTKYRLQGAAVRLIGNYPLAAFSTIDAPSKTQPGALILEGTAAEQDFDTTYIPDQDGYIIVAVHTDYGQLSVSQVGGEVKTPLKIQIFGDSMTDKNWNAGGDVGTTRWVDFLADQLPGYELDIVNSAVGGNTLVKYQPDAESGLYKGVAWQMTLEETTAGSPNSEGYDQYQPLLTDRDLIIVWAGCNEWGVEGLLDDRASLNPTVALADVDISKLYGAVRAIIETVSTKTSAKLLFVTPAQRYTEADSELSTDADGNPLRGWNGYLVPLVDHVDVIREACAFYGVPCLDMHREGSLNRYNVGTWTIDGLHANLAGAKLFAEKIAAAIQNGVGSGGSYGYSKAQIDAALGAYITDVAALVGGDA